MSRRESSLRKVLQGRLQHGVHEKLLSTQDQRTVYDRNYSAETEILSQEAHSFHDATQNLNKAHKTQTPALNKNTV